MINKSVIIFFLIGQELYIIKKKKNGQEEYITQADCGNLFYYTIVCPFDSPDS